MFPSLSLPLRHKPSNRQFLGNLPTGEDLNKNKEVVYLCDFQEKEDSNGQAIIVFPINVSDRITAFLKIPREAIIDPALKLLHGSQKEPVLS